MKSAIESEDETTDEALDQTGDDAISDSIELTKENDGEIEEDPDILADEPDESNLVGEDEANESESSPAEPQLDDSGDEPIQNDLEE